MKIKTYALLLALGSVLGFVLTGSAATRYVAVTNAAPAWPYTNWATAACVIQDAVDAADPGDEILVADGVYATGGRAVYGTMTNRVAIDKAVIVRSVSGPKLTWIVGQGSGGASNTNGDGAVRCVYVGTNAVLSGFTLTNGHTRMAGDYFKEQSGGGAWCELSGVVTNCTLTGNSARTGGGASGGTLNNCTVTGNSAIAGGGAYYGTLNNCTVTGNSASFSGGGTYDGTVNNCILRGNSAEDGGGAYDGTLNNCTLSGNSARRNGGGASRGLLKNCTLTGNSADYDGGGADYGTLKNCIVYYNMAAYGPNYFGSAFTYSCTTPLPSGTGNIDSDPLLASATHISAQSPCIGRGSWDYTSGLDIDGEAWLNPPCMGADQFVAGAATGELSVSIVAAYTNVATRFSVSFAAQISGLLTASVWNFGDGVVVSNRPYTSHTWAVPGLYQVRLTEYNDSFPHGVTATVLVRVAAREVYYVNAANVTPVFPYTNWAGAATNIQEAIDAGAQVGRLVRVTNGVYASGGRAVCGTMTNRVVIPDGVEVRSENGPNLTRIVGQGAGGASNTNGDGAIRCVYVGTNAVLSGFTLTNGHSRITRPDDQEQQEKEGSGGGAWCELSGVLTNCTLIGNSAGFVAGGAYRGTLNDCTLIGNSAFHGGGVSESTVNNCTLIYNSAYYYGGGAHGGSLSNCTFLANTCSFFGAGVAGGVLHNCTVTGNSARDSGGGVYGSLVYNSIIYYNTASSAWNFDGNGFFAYSCTRPQPGGEGNITNAPLFIDTNGWSNLRLQSNSPCINAGNNLYVAGDKDMDGRSRIVGQTVDMGAFEYQGPGMSEFIPWLQQHGLPRDGSADGVDSDGDGLNNWQEWLSKCEPTNPESVLRLLAPVQRASDVQLRWQSVAGVLYQLEYCTNLVTSAGFQALSPVIPGETNRTSFYDTNATWVSPRFYRVRVLGE